MFSLESAQVPVMRNMFFIIAFFSIINWCSSVFNQLLIANEQIHLVEKVNILRNSLSFAVVVATFLFNWTIITYFFYIYFCEYFSNNTLLFSSKKI